MRSSPKRICGFISPADASTSPVEQVAQMARDGRRADVERDPECAVVQPGPRARDRRAVVHGDGDRAGSLEQRALEIRRTRRVGVELVELPLRGECLSHASQVTCGDSELGSCDLDVVEAHDRVDLDRMCVGLLADDLAVELALGRNVDDDVTAEAGGAGQSSSLREPTIGRVSRFHLGGGRQARRRRHDRRASRARLPRPRSGSGRRCRARRRPSRGRHRASSPPRARSCRARTVLACRTG